MKWNWKTLMKSKLVELVCYSKKLIRTTWKYFNFIFINIFLPSFYCIVAVIMQIFPSVWKVNLSEVTPGGREPKQVRANVSDVDNEDFILTIKWHEMRNVSSRGYAVFILTFDDRILCKQWWQVISGRGGGGWKYKETRRCRDMNL